MNTIKVRLAKNEDGSRIGELARQSGFSIDIDWSEVYPFWLVAEEERIIGVVQIILAKPMGWIENLFLDPDLTDIKRARVVRRLGTAGMVSLKKFGAQIVMFSIPHELKSYKKALKKRGAVVTSSGSVLAKRL